MSKKGIHLRGIIPDGILSVILEPKVFGILLYILSDIHNAIVWFIINCEGLIHIGVIGHLKDRYAPKQLSSPIHR
jgi:hypothetical protein